jgi:hypothetical protein
VTATFSISSADSSLLATRYETLRGAALGEPLLPGDRWGLALLVRRGVWSWARAAMTETPREPARPSSAVSALGPGVDQAVVRALASLALDFEKETPR